jgi:hypothetical protein
MRNKASLSFMKKTRVLLPSKIFVPITRCNDVSIFGFFPAFSASHPVQYSTVYPVVLDEFTITRGRSIGPYVLILDLQLSHETYVTVPSYAPASFPSHRR